MSRTTILAGLLALLAGACGGTPEPPPATPAPATPVDEPVFKVWEMGALARARTDAPVPFLIDAAGAPVETPCFERARGLQPWNTGRPQVVTRLEANGEAIRAAIRAWAAEAILGGEAVEGLTDTVTIEWETPVIVHAPNERVRLVADQACVDPRSRSLPAGARAVTTLFGARELRFIGREPLTRNQISALRKVADKARLRFRTVRDAPRALDGAGLPAVDGSGAKLFVGPDGTPVTADALPPEKSRPVIGFRLSFASPLWFAWGDLPGEVWASEREPAECRLNLVFDDFVPRVPECDGPDDVGFGASRGRTASEVVLKVSADGVTASVPAQVGETVMIQAGGRVICWLTPSPIVEGVELAVDTLVLDPAGGPGGDLAPFGKPPKAKAKKKP